MSARSQVTITLGRGGQVVKRTGVTSDVVNAVYSPPRGSKRSLRDRLGDIVEDDHKYVSQFRSKRQRREHDWSLDDDLNNDKRHASNHWIGRNDLRHKLLTKSLHRRSNPIRHPEYQIDLREKLSRNTQVPLRHESRQRMGPRTSGSTRRIVPTRSADDLLQLDPLRKSYSSWAPDGRRHSSPDQFIGASRAMTPRHYDELQHVSSRSVYTSRPPMYTSKDVLDASRRSAIMAKPSVPVESSNPVLQVPLPGGIVQKSSHMPEEPVTVAGLLHSLGLGKYAILFQAEEVDMAALRQMGDNDLKELGIPMGPRKKILLAVLPRMKRHC